ncbi:MAG: hydroxyacid dehydrogenase [Aeromicrobium sp.]
MDTFRVGLTRDFLKQDGSIAFGDIGLDVLEEAPNVSWEFLPTSNSPLLAADIRHYDALVVLSPKVTAETLVGADRLRIVARFGVGIDNVDLDACTRAGVMVTITPDGVRRPVAVAAMAFLLGLAHRIRSKDRITREGLWDTRLDYQGFGLVGRTLGIVGFGNIGREIARLAQPFDLRVIAHDPFVTSIDSGLGVELVDLEGLLRRSDFVCLSCPLTEQTRHLIDATGLSMMKPTAFLINVARGPVVDEPALVDALHRRTIMGAALDVFEDEPPSIDNPLFALDSVILAPHSAAWTDEVFRDNGKAACAGILMLMNHETPAHVVNRDVLEHSRVTQWLRQPDEVIR